MVRQARTRLQQALAARERKQVDQHRRGPRKHLVAPERLQHEADEGWARYRAETQSFPVKWRKWYAYFCASLTPIALAFYAFLESCSGYPEAADFLQDERVQPIFVSAVSAVLAAGAAAGTAVWAVFWILLILPFAVWCWKSLIGAMR